MGLHNLTIDCEFHVCGGVTNGVSRCTLIAAVIIYADVVDSKMPRLADGELGTLGDLNPLLGPRDQRLGVT